MYGLLFAGTGRFRSFLHARGMSDDSIYRFDIESFRIGRVNIDFFCIFRYIVVPNFCS